MQYLFNTAMEQLEALNRGQVTAVALLEQTIEHAERLDSVLNPFALKLYKRARSAAKIADKKRAKGQAGPLSGLPITIKDSQFLAGYPCANGSRTLRNFIPDNTCRAIELLEQAGAVIFAKTTCPEFSLTGITSSEMYGLTSNPWNPKRTSGGSSGGAAVAVAAGLGSFSLGGDGGGSIRIPSSFCGIVGFKPSFGFIPREPCFPSWQSIVSYGPMTRTVTDTRLFYSVLNPTADFDHEETQLNLANYPLIVSEDLGFAPVDDDVRQAFRSVVKRLVSKGAQIFEDKPGLPSSIITWAVTASFDAAQHADKKIYKASDLGDTARGFIEFGNSFNEDDFEQAQAYRETVSHAYRTLFERTGSSILITPTLGCEAFEHGSIHPYHVGETPITLPWLDWAGFLYDANLAGLPACAIPMGVGDEGLPLSLQILGPEGSDDEVLRVAQAIEALIGWDNSIVIPASSQMPINASA